MAKEFEQDTITYGHIIKIALVTIFGVLAVVVIFSSFVIIPAGTRGVVLRFGHVEPYIFGEGLHLKVPISDSVIKMEVRTQKYEATATAASKDLQDTKTTVALNYHLEPETVNTIYQSLGSNYADKFIQPAVQEVVKASTAKYTAEELITKRALVKDDIDNGLKDRLSGRGIVVETLSITDFSFSDQFTQAIEAKVTATQNALKAENDLVRIQVEAQQVVATASGAANSTLLKAQAQAQAIELIQNQLKSSPEYVKYQAILQWDGKLPMITGGSSIPIIQLPTGTTQ